MWASVVLVDYLRNGVPLEDAPKAQVGRALAALTNCYRRPLDEYWERRIEELDGAYFAYTLDQAGYSGWEMMSFFGDYGVAISEALADRSWEALCALPDKVWKLLRHVTGMAREEWEQLPDFCRELLAKRMTCPGCGRSETLDRFGEPDPIDDPTRFYQNRMDLTLHCPKCGASLTFDIPAGVGKEYTPQAVLSKKVFGRMVVGVFGALVVIALYLIFRTGYFWRGP
jgi:hypothetical protein